MCGSAIPVPQVYPPGHPVDPSFRDGLRGPEFAKPVTVGNDVWVGGGAIILGALHRSDLHAAFCYACICSVAGCLTQALKHKSGGLERCYACICSDAGCLAEA